MSTLKVEVVSVEQVNVHPNADRLELAMIKGWQVVTQKDQFKPGDLAVYIPIDSILPMEVEIKIFGIDSKVKLTKSRVKTIRLRGSISQGLITTFETLGLNRFKYKEGDDLTSKLGVTKYKPPEPSFQSNVGSGRKASTKEVNVNFRKYTDIQNVKNYNKLFGPGSWVVLTEKIHGTNFRAGYVGFDANTIWKKIKKFFGLVAEQEFVYGSHNVQLQNKMLYKGFYNLNVYSRTVVEYQLKDKLYFGEVVYGEIYGPGIQKGYHYGKKDGEFGLVVFDVMANGRWLDHGEMVKFCQDRDLPMVPVVFDGPVDDRFNLDQFIDGPSVLCPTQKVREGVVMRSHIEMVCHMGRAILKCINPEYLLKDQTEFH